MDAEVAEKLKDCLRKVTPFSQVIKAVLKELGEEPVNMDRVCHTLELDPILASAVLRLANSPFYGFARKINSVKDAAVLLGVHTLRQVVISFSMVSAFPMRGGVGLDREAKWRHSVGVAVAAKRLAEQTGHNGDEAFIAGILHDIGQFILDQCLQEEYRKVFLYLAEQGGTLEDVERKMLGIDHRRVGAVAIRHWKLPEALADAALNHAYAAVNTNPAPLTDLIHVANMLALGLWIDNDEKPVMERFSPQAMERLGIDWEGLEAQLPKIDTMSQEVIGRLLH